MLLLDRQQFTDGILWVTRLAHNLITVTATATLMPNSHLFGRPQLIALVLGLLQVPHDSLQVHVHHRLFPTIRNSVIQLCASFLPLVHTITHSLSICSVRWRSSRRICISDVLRLALPPPSPSTASSYVSLDNCWIKRRSSALWSVWWEDMQSNWNLI